MSICKCGGETKKISSGYKPYSWIAECCKGCGRVSMDRLYDENGLLVACGVEARSILNKSYSDGRKHQGDN